MSQEGNEQRMLACGTWEGWSKALGALLLHTQPGPSSHRLLGLH